MNRGINAFVNGFGLAQYGPPTGAPNCVMKNMSITWTFFDFLISAESSQY